MTSLYEIGKDYQELLNMDLDEQTLADTLESLTDEFDTKAESICKVLAEYDAKIESIAAEAKRLTDRKKTMSNKADQLKNYLKENMEVLGHKKIEKELFTITLIAGRDILSVVDETKIPDSYFKTSEPVRSLDKKAVLDDLKSDVQIEGAAIGTGNSSLRIY